MTRLRWTIGKRLAAGFALAAVLLAVVGGISFRSSGELAANEAAVNHTYAVLTAVDTVTADLKDAETGQRGFVITGADDYLAPFTAATSAVTATSTRSRDSPRTTPRSSSASPSCAPWCSRRSRRCSRPSTCAATRVSRPPRPSSSPTRARPSWTRSAV